MNPASLRFTDGISYMFDEIHIFPEVFFSLRIFDRAVLWEDLALLAVLTHLCFFVEELFPLSSITKVVTLALTTSSEGRLLHNNTKYTVCNFVV